MIASLALGLLSTYILSDGLSRRIKIQTIYNTPKKLDRGIRRMIACHTDRGRSYGTKHSKRP